MECGWSGPSELSSCCNLAVKSGGEASINIWKQYYSTLLNEEFDWNRGSLGEQPAVIGPAELFTINEV